MRILIFIGSSNGVALHRLIVPYHKISELTNEDEFQIDFFTYQGQPNKDIVELASTYDFFVFNRTLPPNLIHELKGHTKLIDDCDDDWTLPTSHPLYLNYLLNGTTKTIIEHLQLSDYVTTTTEYLAKKISNVSNKQPTIFPNALEPSEQFTPTKSESKRVRFGILGSSSHVPDMELLHDIGNQLDKSILDRIQFVLCGFDSGKVTTYDQNGNKRTEQMPFEDTIWAYWERSLSDNYSNLSNNYTDALKKFDRIDLDALNEPYRRVWSKDIFSYGTMYNDIDCLLVPLVDSEFNRCKSPLKLAECSVTNTGVLCSNVQPYTPYLTDCQKINNAKRTRGFIQGIKRYLNAEDRSIYVPKLTDKGQPFNLEQITNKRINWFREITKQA